MLTQGDDMHAKNIEAIEKILSFVAFLKSFLERLILHLVQLSL